MKLKLAHTKWCIGFVAIVFMNLQLSLLLLRSYDKNITSNNARLNMNYQNFAQLINSLNQSNKKAWNKSGHGLASQIIRPSDLEILSVADMSLPKTGLPSFVADASEFVLSSIIERVPNSWSLYVTTFMLGHHLLQPSDIPFGVMKVHPKMKEVWRRAGIKFQDASYSASGIRIQKEKFYCQISNSVTKSTYLVEGHFMPNRLTADSNLNRKLDIVRCPLQDARGAYLELSGSSESVRVEIIRGNFSLVNFTIPWATRRSGLYLTSPSAASRLDVWKGFDKDLRNQPPKMSEAHRLHICNTGVKQLPNKKIFPKVIEFVSHHLLVGADHVHLPLTVAWSSEHMAVFIEVFRSYIDEGRLSIQSQSGDNLDMVQSFAGLSWQRGAVKIFQANMCLYLAKGLAEYVMILDIDEFFIPKKPYNSIMEVIQSTIPSAPLPHYPVDTSVDQIFNNWTRRSKTYQDRRGWASSDAHPYCFIRFFTEVLLNPHPGGSYDTSRPWLGQRFAHGPEPRAERLTKQFTVTRSILPTDKIYQTSLSVGGACRLPWEWTSCSWERPRPSKKEDEYCLDGRKTNRTMASRRFHTTIDGRVTKLQFFHDFDEQLHEGDAYELDMDTQGSVYHMLILREDLVASELALTNSTSEYATRFFPFVLNDLRSRGLNLLLLLKDAVRPIDTVEGTWTKLYSQEDIVLAKLREEAASKPTSLNSNSSSILSSKKVVGATSASSSSVSVYKLRTTYENRSFQEEEVELPNFARDYSEFLLGSMIERVSDSWDLYLTSFFLCHKLLSPKLESPIKSGEKISPEVKKLWQKTMRIFETTEYGLNGMRLDTTTSFTCRITHKDGDIPYEVPGQFVPNKLTPDANANRRLDILRCKMENSKLAYLTLARSAENATVEILKGGHSIFKFKVSWRTRQTGFTMYSAAEATQFDAWKGFSALQPKKWSHDRLYLCVPGFEAPPSKNSLPYLLEFLQHHLLLGVQHVFLGVLFAWDSPHMRLLLNVLRSYIEEKKITVVSNAGDGFDGVYSTAGLQWLRDNAKSFHVNMCLYLAKGVADYVGIWDLDEFFIPLGENKNILDVIQAAEGPQPRMPYFHPPNADKVAIYERGWMGGPGLADKDAHPFCYLSLNSVVTMWAKQRREYDYSTPWLGKRFAHGSEAMGHGLGFTKSIHPTRRIFQSGLHVGGACKLPEEWNGCSETGAKKGEEFCYGMNGRQLRLTRFPNGSAINFNLNHMFDEMVNVEDAKTIDQSTQGVINHIQYHREHLISSPQAAGRKGDYAEAFFPNVLQALDERGLALPMLFRDAGVKPFPSPDDQWIPIEQLTVEIGEAADMLGAASKATTSEEQVVPHTDSPMSPPVIQSEEGGSESENEETYASLPTLATDRSELFLASLIEREEKSWNLHLTTFMLSHSLIDRDNIDPYGRRVKNDRETLEAWKQAYVAFKQAQYLPNGLRTLKPIYYCKIKNKRSGEAYTVKGQFIPNKLTPDFNANRRLDTLRCKMEDGEKAYMELARTDEEVAVEIFREETMLIRFHVSWRTRVQSSLLSHPPGMAGVGLKGTMSNPIASTLDAWKGFDAARPGVWEMDKVHLCAPGLDSVPNRKTVPIYLEFVQHHLLMGVSHVHLAAPLSWTGLPMFLMLRMLRSYIEEGTASMFSHAGDGIDYLYSTYGLSWGRDTMKVFQINFCVYFLKGLAEYVAIWDNDEFFIPLGRHRSLVDFIASTENPAVLDNHDGQVRRWKHEGREGWASGDAHPYCYLQMHSKVVANHPTLSSDSQFQWMGQRFAHETESLDLDRGKKQAFKKSIIPTKNMFQIGLHMSGACKMPWPWHGCEDKEEEYCSKPDEDYLRLKEPSLHYNHRFDEIVRDEDTYVVDKDEEAVIYHYMIYRYYYTTDRSTRLDHTNEYTAKHFARTMAELKRRNLDLIVEIPAEASLEAKAGTATWTNYLDVYLAKDNVNGG